MTLNLLLPVISVASRGVKGEGEGGSLLGGWVALPEGIA